MKKIILIILITLFTSGCSLIPRINFDTPNTVPQSIEKGKVKELCKGKAEWDELGNIKSCSKGYYKYDESYNKAERKYTIKEKIINFFRNLTGISFWVVIALIILCPGVVGLIFGRIIEGTVGIASKALKSTVKAIQNVRKNGKNIDDSLSAEQDADVKSYIKKIKDKENIK